MKNKNNYLKKTVEFLKWLVILTFYFYCSYIIGIFFMFINWGRISDHRIAVSVMTIFPILFLIIMTIKSINNKNKFRVYMFIFFIIYEIFLPIQDYYNVENDANLKIHVEKSTSENISYFFKEYYGRFFEKHVRKL